MKGERKGKEGKGERGGEGNRRDYRTDRERED